MSVKSSGFEFLDVRCLEAVPTYRCKACGVEVFVVLFLTPRFCPKCGQPGPVRREKEAGT